MGKRLTESWRRVAVGSRNSVQSHFYENKIKMDGETGMEVDNGAKAESERQLSFSTKRIPYLVAYIMGQS